MVSNPVVRLSLFTFIMSIFSFVFQNITQVVTLKSLSTNLNLWTVSEFVSTCCGLDLGFCSKASCVWRWLGYESAILTVDVPMDEFTAHSLWASRPECDLEGLSPSLFSLLPWCCDTESFLVPDPVLHIKGNIMRGIYDNTSFTLIKFLKVTISSVRILDAEFWLHLIITV